MSIQFLIDEKGKKTGVFLSIKEYEELLERLEDVEALTLLQKIGEKDLETRRFDDFLSDFS